MTVPIVPLPRKVAMQPGHFSLPQDLRVSSRGPGAEAVADYFSEHLPLYALAPSQVVRDTAETAHVQLCVKPRNDQVRHEEGYVIQVTEPQIQVLASNVGGLFYGVQSLLQMIAASQGGELPCCDIQDEPRFRWRGMHLDVGRHFFSVDAVKRYLDLMALYKFNTFHWHLTDDQGWRFPVPQYPRLTEVSAWRTESDGSRYGGFYSAEEIAGIVEYAAERRIRVLPEIESPGHSVAALAAYPELSCTGGPLEVASSWGIFDDVFCAGNDDVFAFLEGVLQEVMRLFPCEYVHIGGDVCSKARWKQCPRCQKRMRQEKLKHEDELQSWFIRRVSRFLEEQGRILIGWDEILEGGLAPGATVMSWRGTEGGIAAAQQGHDVIMSPTSHCYLNYKQADSEHELGVQPVLPLEAVYTLNPVPTVLDTAQRQHVLGGQGNVWTEHIVTEQDLQYMVLPRMTALAECLWTRPGAKQWDSYRQRVPQHSPLWERLGYRGYRRLDDIAPTGPVL